MSFRKTRSILYKIDRLSGDFKAVKNGTIGSRIGKRILRRMINRLLWRFFKIYSKIHPKRAVCNFFADGFAIVP